MKIFKLIVKITLFIAILIPLLCSVSWYYLTGKITEEVNKQFANKEHNITLSKDVSYQVKFDAAKAIGFPFELALEIYNWQEQNNESNITYINPIKVGYNLLSQNLFASYDGEVNVSYKKSNSNIDAKFNIVDYKITLAMPLMTISSKALRVEENKLKSVNHMASSLFETLRSMKDPFELVNNIGAFKASSGNTQITDLNNNNIIYNKTKENFKLTFVKDRYYTSSKDLLENIPQEYDIFYSVKSPISNSRISPNPKSLFYLFSFIPSGRNIELDCNVKTRAKKIENIANQIEVLANIRGNDRLFDINMAKINYKNTKNNDRTLLINSKAKLNPGFFDLIFEGYKYSSNMVRALPKGDLVDREIQYVIDNKDVFKFNELENMPYEFNVDLKSSHIANNKIIYKFNDLSVFTPNSGLKLKHQIVTNLKNDKDWEMSGLLLLKNYESFVEFSSGYIYRFGKFKVLNDQARKLYIDVNKAFLRKISDYPDAKSNDLTIAYSSNSFRLHDTTIGTFKIGQIVGIYQGMLYSKLLSAVGIDGDVIAKMRKILPDIDSDSPLLKRFLPADKASLKETGKKIEQEVKENVKDEVKKILKDDQQVKDLGKKLFKGLIK